MEPRQRGSAEQFAVLIEYMERHGDLAKPQLGAQGRRRSTEKWQELTTIINSVGGGVVKPVEKWKKVWADWKTKTKKKYLDNRQDASGTGGGPGSRHRLTTLEERVVSVLGRSAVLGMPVLRERGFNTAPPLANPVEVSNIQVAASPAPTIHLPTSPPLPSPPPPPSSPLPQPSCSHLLPPPLPLPSPPPPPSSPLPQPSCSHLLPPPLPLQSPPPPSSLPLSRISSPRGRRPRDRRYRSRSPQRSEPRRNRGLTPFERAAKYFAAVEERRLDFEKERHADWKRAEERRIEFEKTQQKLNYILINKIFNAHAPK